MARGLDYVSGPPVQAMKDAGIAFVCRYVGYFQGYDIKRIATQQGKVLTPGEAQTLGAGRIALVSNYEWTAGRATEGFQAGVWDAQMARDIHAGCGGPVDRPIYFSVDEDVDSAQVLEYFKGVESVLGLSRVGAYGSVRVLTYLFDVHAITWGWQTYAWSRNQWEPRAQIQQYSNGQKLAGSSVDFDRSMTPDFGQWAVGGEIPTIMQHYSEHSADFGTWFTAQDADHWLCHQTGLVVQYGIKGFYASLSMDGETLPVVGLPLTNEIYLTLPGGKQVVLQVFERAGIWYDPAHNKDTQPGTGGCALCHLTDADFLKYVPGLALPTQPKGIDPQLLAAIEADINNLPEVVGAAIATPVARVLADLAKLKS